nr:MAG TPA: hypothetical protein [Caudoviricetes sp.]
MFGLCASYKSPLSVLAVAFFGVFFCSFLNRFHFSFSFSQSKKFFTTFLLKSLVIHVTVETFALSL